MTGAELDAAGLTDPRLRLAYQRCRELNARHGKTYYLATKLLTRAQRPAVHALYGFARWADDIVDTAPPGAGRWSSRCAGYWPTPVCRPRPPAGASGPSRARVLRGPRRGGAGGTAGAVVTGLGYTVPAVAAVAAVCVWELAFLRTGLFRLPSYWVAVTIVLAFQIPVDGWLTKLSAPVVEYAPGQMTGLRFPWDIPVEDFLFGFALVTSALLLWERQGCRPGRGPGRGRAGHDPRGEPR